MKTRQYLTPRERVELMGFDVDYKGKYLTFQHPLIGPGTYVKVKKSIETAKLGKPTMAETASLILAIYNSEDKPLGDFIKKQLGDFMGQLRSTDNQIWAFTGILCIPKEGAYIQDDPETRNRRPFMDKSRLVKILEEETSKKVKTVRFVPFGYKTGGVTPLELEKNKFVIGLAEEEGAEKLAEVADKFKRDPFLYALESVSRPAISVCSLQDEWFSDFGLGVHCSNYGYKGGNGFALGYLSRQKTFHKKQK